MCAPTFHRTPPSRNRRCERRAGIQLAVREFYDDVSAYQRPATPKRPRTAYNLFFRDQQEKINEMKALFRNKSVNAAAIVSVCWKELRPDKKAYYCILASEDKLRYYREKDEYQTALAAEVGTYSAPDNDQRGIDVVPPYSRQSIALLASRLDGESIDFLIKALK